MPHTGAAQGVAAASATDAFTGGTAKTWWRTGLPSACTGSPLVAHRRRRALDDAVRPSTRTAVVRKLEQAHRGPLLWKKCSFCDVSLDYLLRYDAATAQTLVDRIDAIVAETGQTGW